jgi:AIPR protein
MPDNSETDAINWVDTEVKKRQDAEYSDAQQAFAHVAMRVLLDLDDDESYEACEVGGEFDNAPDAFWLDESSGRGILAIVSYAPNAKASGDLDLVARMVGAIGRLAPDRIQSDSAASAALPRQLAAMRNRDVSVPLEAWIVCFGSMDDASRAEFDIVRKGQADSDPKVRLIELDVFLGRVTETLSRDAPAMNEPVTLTLRDHFRYDADPPAIIANIDALQLAELERRYGFRIFQGNVRYLLSGKQLINEGIADTIGDANERDNFWYYNNGIAVMCDSFDESTDADGSTTLTIHNFQIVNGCQTTATLARTIDVLRVADPPVRILARIVASKDAKLRENIPLFNNRQNAVKDRDLQSNDRIQTNLQGLFDNLQPPWFYVRKRGEWEARGGNGRLKKRFGDRRVENDVAAQAYYAFFHNAAVARARKRYLFTSKSDNGFYEEIFNADTKPEPLLLAYRSAKVVKKEVNAYRREIRGIKRGRGSAVEQKKLDREWLKFGEQYVLGVIGWHVLRRASMNGPVVERLATDRFDEFIKVAYPLAVRDLTLYFRRIAREQPMDPDGVRERIDFANFVKANWQDVQQTLDAEWTEVRAGEPDPLATFFA